VQIAVGIALLLLAAAVVLLFAMFGELAARVGRPTAGDRAAVDVQPVDGARIGTTPSVWPGRLAEVPSNGRAVVLSLSTSCGSCREVAEQLAQGDARRYAIALASPDPATGADFLASYQLTGLPHHVDVGGQWLRGELGVQHSPAALVFRDGELVSASIFTDVRALAVANAV
jgi:hypothetical protein